MSQDRAALAAKMASQGKILIWGDFTPDLRDSFYESLITVMESTTSKENGWCTLYIDSSGGSSEILDSIRCYMIDSQLKFRGLVQSKAKESAFLLLQYCHWRVALSNTTIQLSLPKFNDSLSLAGANSQQNLMRLEKVLKNLSARCGLSISVLREYADSQLNLLAEEAYSKGFLDEVISYIPTSVKPAEGVFFDEGPPWHFLDGVFFRFENGRTPSEKFFEDL